MIGRIAKGLTLSQVRRVEQPSNSSTASQGRDHRRAADAYPSCRPPHPIQVSMPALPPRLCQCGRIVEAGSTCICRAAAKAAWEAKRGTPASRGYDAEWRRLRLRFLASNPQCAALGCAVPAAEVDHILSVRTHPHLRLAWSNLRPFCKRHHSQRTARDHGFARKI